MKPKLIDEITCQKLSGQDRKDYIEAVKNYNQTGDKCFLSAALYFENGKEPVHSRIDMSLYKVVQFELEKLSQTHSQRQIATACGIGIGTISRIQNGYKTAITDTILNRILKRLKKEAA